MRGALIVLAGLCLALSSATPAFAQGGTGLYEPFPKPRFGEHSFEFVQRLRGDRERLQALTQKELEHGVVLGPSAPPTSTKLASSRGEPTAGLAPSMGWAGGLMLLGALAAGAVLIVKRRA